MSPEQDPDGWFPDHETHNPPKRHAAVGVRFLRRRADRRRLRAVLFQSVALLILSGGVLLLAGIGEVYADDRYDGRSDWRPVWCWTTEAPDGFPQCEVTR